ncbi:class II aldolase/adducin family protein [Sphingomonas sp. HITSZ_GF]|uniref:class II aldolase/adducin family protein n=1 Tax=Sphingomonas sp. HITSZ_GF TaxID=3037247 RepID=UPI00240E0025|nr:class II aldolase/adducin family protein [Sphingomonas sp. HITSZ_GF]MDG2535760.1 class II aldolase/adducin family protein [Sphingomonas sp. HITSZ_GF]
MSSLNDLASFSAKWGSDFLLVQGAGGNTSRKQGDRLVVKASGLRLADALARDVFVDVAMTDALAMIDGGKAPTGANGLRASIEASLHAVMPGSIVAHLHMVSLIAVAVRADAEAVLAERLAGLNWAFLPYLQPGAAVAQAVQASLAERGPMDVLVLGNHGIVLQGETFQAIEALLADVDRRLAYAPAETGPRDEEKLARVAARFGLEPARLEQTHLAALDPAALRHATTGSLYPDHVVFLGRGAGIVDEESDALQPDRLLHFVPGAGALLAPGLPDEAHEMAACLSEVARRIPANATVAPLSAEAENVLANWDAEIYRRNLAAHPRLDPGA